MPGVSKKTICELSLVRMPVTRLRVVCGLGLTMATFSPRIWFSNVDLPTFGRPTMAIVPERDGGTVFSLFWSCVSGIKLRSHYDILDGSFKASRLYLNSNSLNHAAPTDAAAAKAAHAPRSGYDRELARLFPGARRQVDHGGLHAQAPWQRDGRLSQGDYFSARHPAQDTQIELSNHRPRADAPGPRPGGRGPARRFAAARRTHPLPRKKKR